MTRKGFTLIELAISIVFISVLSIVVVVLINNSVSAYHRGLVLNKLNEVGSEIVDDMRRAIQASPATSLVKSCADVNDNANGTVCEEDAENGRGWKLVNVEYTATVKRNDNTDIGDDVPVSGAFCTGLYSYIWNSGYFFSDEYKVSGSKATFSYNIKTNEDGEIGSGLWGEFRLLKVRDEYRDVCVSASYDGNGPDFDITDKKYHTIAEEPEELLGGSGENLALYDLSVALPAENLTGRTMFYSASFILGTLQGGINIKASGNYCAAPSEYDSALDYCAINKFNFASQAMGEESKR